MSCLNAIESSLARRKSDVTLPRRCSRNSHVSSHSSKMRYNCSLTRTRRLTSSSRSSADSHRDQLIRSQVHFRIVSVHLAALGLHRIRTHRVSKADLPPRTRLRIRSLGIVRPSRTVRIEGGSASAPWGRIRRSSFGRQSNSRLLTLDLL